MTNERRILNQTLNSLIQKQQNQIVFFSGCFLLHFCLTPSLAPPSLQFISPSPKLSLLGVNWGA